MRSRLILLSGFIFFSLVFLSLSRPIAVQSQSAINWGLSFVTGWIQTQGGNTYATQDIGAVAIPTPTPASGGYFSLGEPNLNTNPGIVSCGGTCSSYGGGSVSSMGWKVEGQLPVTTQYDYAFYADRLKPGTCPTRSTLALGDINASGLHCFTAASAGVPITLERDTVVSSSTYSIVLINGDLNVNKTISVNQSIPPGGFVTFIVSGNITFASTVALAQGMYIATKQLLVASNGTDPLTELQFTGRGVFVGYGGVTIQRTLGPRNAQNPSALFVYDPMLLRAAFPTTVGPSILSTKIDWRELPP